MERRAPAEELEFRVRALGPAISGALCLDFANTIEPRGGPHAEPRELEHHQDHLRDGRDLVAWGLRQGLYDHGQALAMWPLLDRSGVARRLLGQADVLRDAVYRSFASVAAGEQPPGRDLAELQAFGAEALRAASWVAVGPHLKLDWPEPQPRNVIRQVAVSALDLLRDPELAKIKICPGEGRGGMPCGWLFLDTTKNRSRRWCSMADCGNVSKGRRQNARRRAERGRS